MFGLGVWELLIIVGVFVLLFGSTRLPGLFRNLGASIAEFRKGAADSAAAVEEMINGK